MTAMLNALEHLDNDNCIFIFFGWSIAIGTRQVWAAPVSPVGAICFSRVYSLINPK